MRAVFLDRDGVVNENPGEKYYVKTTADFVMLPGAVAAVKQLKAAGFKVFVVSNQSGIGRKAMTQKSLDEITALMHAEFKKGGTAIDGVFYCPHDDADTCVCRKPKDGLYHMAAKGLDLDKNASFCIGDSDRDIESGKQFGVRSLLVLSGKSTEADVKSFPKKPDGVFKDLTEAAAWILKKSAS